MDTVTYPAREVRAELERWLEARVDVSRSPGVARAFGVPAVPTAVAAAPDGRILARIENFVEPGAFAAWLRSAR